MAAINTAIKTGTAGDGQGGGGDPTMLTGFTGGSFAGVYSNPQTFARAWGLNAQEYWDIYNSGPKTCPQREAFLAVFNAYNAGGELPKGIAVNTATGGASMVSYSGDGMSPQITGATGQQLNPGILPDPPQSGYYRTKMGMAMAHDPGNVLYGVEATGTWVDNVPTGVEINIIGAPFRISEYSKLIFTGPVETESDLTALFRTVVTYNIMGDLFDSFGPEAFYMIWPQCHPAFGQKSPEQFSVTNAIFIEENNYCNPCC